MDVLLKKEVKTLYSSVTVVSSVGELVDAKQCIVFIPGNPGIIEFYDIFIKELCKLSNYTVPVIGISQGGHSPAWHYDSDIKDTGEYLNLHEQIQHKIEYILKEIPKHVKLILIGHSVGAYIVLKILENKSISSRLKKAILLFPAIEELKHTPNGKFWMPVSKYCRIPFALLALAFSFAPLWFKNILVAWRSKGRKVDDEVIRPCHSCVSFSLMNQALYMAASEMDHMNELDEDLIETIQIHINKLTFYYGSADNWAPYSFYERMIDRFPEADIRLCKQGFPHDFVLDSSREVAQLCHNIIFLFQSEMEDDNKDENICF